MASRNQRAVAAQSGRSLIIAYLSYALPDVAALSPIALELLKNTITSLCEGHEMNGKELRQSVLSRR